MHLANFAMLRFSKASHSFHPILTELFWWSTKFKKYTTRTLTISYLNYIVIMHKTMFNLVSFGKMSNRLSRSTFFRAFLCEKFGRCIKVLLCHCMVMVYIIIGVFVSSIIWLLSIFVSFVYTHHNAVTCTLQTNTNIQHRLSQYSQCTTQQIPGHNSYTSSYTVNIFCVYGSICSYEQMQIWGF